MPPNAPVPTSLRALTLPPPHPSRPAPQPARAKRAPTWPSLAPLLAATLGGAWLACGPAQALEPATLPSYLNGAEGFMAGAVPPPGLYGLLYAAHVQADRVNDDQGHALPVPGFKTRLTATVGRLAWVTGQQWLGGDLVLHTLLPLLEVRASGPGGTTTRSGLGDVVVGAGLGFHHSPQWHTVLALDLHLPTGAYDATSPVNLGGDHRVWEPVLALTRVDPSGLNADLRTGLSLHERHAATGYRSGRDLHSDFSLGWGLQPGWVLGVGGHHHQQLSDDQSQGHDLPGSRMRSTALGPMVKFDSGQGWLLTVKWQQDLSARNAPQGKGLFVKAVFPLP